MSNPHALGRFTYACENKGKANHMVIFLRMLAPEFEFQYGQYVGANIMKHGVVQKGPHYNSGAGYVLIDYERMEINPEFIRNLNIIRELDRMKQNGSHLIKYPIYSAT